MGESLEPPLVSGHFDRDAGTRMSSEALTRAWQDPAARLLRVLDGQLPLRRVREESGERGGIPALDLVRVRGALSEDHCYLGRAAGDPVFAMLGHEDDGYDAPDGGWVQPFLLEDELSPVQLELMTVAFALLNWHRTSRFSPRDGGDTHPGQGGWARHDAHGGEYFPRTDPAVIVLIEHDDRVLLGSNVLWEADRFSLLAGFVEAGESAEQTVRREILEEAGVLVGEVRYVASQPWPFPRSLMLGFRAGLAPGVDPAELAPDAAEISELRWFTRQELRDPATGIRLPGRLSIARWLIDLWLDEGDSGR